MLRPLLYLICSILFCNAPGSSIKTRNINSVSIETIVQDSTLNVRAIEIVQLTDRDNACIFLTSDGRFGSIFSSAFVSSFDDSEFGIHMVDLKTDSIRPNFRALAASYNNGFGITIGSPALIYKLDADLEKNKIVYRDNHPKAFYDAMAFWNKNEGLAIGDPTDGCMSILITRDAGENWEKLPCDKLPKAIDGEAAFAASDTNIAIVGDHTWVATGGKVSRILFSADKGHSWTVYETPIVQGKETTGMYSIDFYDDLYGFAIGGDYTNPDDNMANKIRTDDGGKTWTIVGAGKDPGYRSCIQYVPNGHGQELVAVGFKGIDYSRDGGKRWKHLSDEGFYTIRFLNDSIAYAAGKGKVSKLLFRE